MKKLSVIALLSLPLFAVKIPKELKELKHQYGYVPAGKVYFNIDQVLSKNGVGKNATSDFDSLDAFLIAKNEVTNGEYKEFLSAIKISDSSKYLTLLPDTTVWRDQLAYNEPFVEHYFRHPAYNDYPVVGISKNQAEAYCLWLTVKINKEHPDLNLKARLPTKTEWIRAARGEKNWAYALGNSVRNEKGMFLYNFKAIGDEFIHYDIDSSRFEIKGNYNFDSFITVTSNSYWPNQWGLYNMCGNVAEIVGDEQYAYGGSWNSTGHDIKVESKLKAKVASNVGFRVLLAISE